MRQQIIKNIIVNGEPADLYTTWLDFSKQSQFMEHISSVTPGDTGTHHWVMEGPLNTKLEWTTKTTTLEPYKRIAWKTIEGDIKSSGQVTFTSLPQGQAEVTLTSQTIPPTDLIDKVALKLFEDEEVQLEKGLRNFKAFVENRSVTA